MSEYTRQDMRLIGGTLAIKPACSLPDEVNKALLGKTKGRALEGSVICRLMVATCDASAERQITERRKSEFGVYAMEHGFRHRAASQSGNTPARSM
jgi:hypothetical protein